MTATGNNSCCGPRRDASGPAGDASAHPAPRPAVAPAPPRLRDQIRAGLCPIPGGIFEMGARRSTFPADRDSPRRKVRLSPFLIAPAAVTNAEYARFVDDTGYQTVAEREGWSYVFHLLLESAARWPRHPVGLPWWRRVDGACWRAPEGPGSGIAGREDHPVVHVAWFDAMSYCRWSGTMLPTEAQWERAARGGLKCRRFPWGDAIMPGGAHAMNIWQGRFPEHNSAEDGWIGTAPARSFAPNGYGLYNMTGNVWEWVADRFGGLPAAKVPPVLDPTGPALGAQHVQRGGSYLCHDSYCDRYHVHSRTANDPDSSTGNAGFRIAAPAEA